MDWSGAQKTRWGWSAGWWAALLLIFLRCFLFELECPPYEHVGLSRWRSTICFLLKINTTNRFWKRCQRCIALTLLEIYICKKQFCDLRLANWKSSRLAARLTEIASMKTLNNHYSFLVVQLYQWYGRIHQFTTSRYLWGFYLYHKKKCSFCHLPG